MAAEAPFRYDAEWLTTQMGTHEWGRRALLGAFAHLGIPRSLLDIGCGDGYLVDFAAQMGIDAVGADVAPDERLDTPGRILNRDLTQPMDLGQRFDMVISWETGEHLPFEAHDVFVDSIMRHAGGFIVFTAAIEGQGGDGHIACAPLSYWRQKFEERGADYLANATEHLRDTWVYTTGEALWYPQNIQVFIVADRPSVGWYNA